MADETKAAEVQAGDRLKGLTDEEVLASRKLHGKNEVYIPEEPWYWTLGKTFLQPMSIMLELAMIIAGAGSEWEDFAIITAMLLVNSFLAFYEDIKAKASVAALKSKMVNHVDTIRIVDGRRTYVPLDPKQLVVGDVIHLRGGDAIPADCEFWEGADIQVNTAAMTGESLPVKFSADGPWAVGKDGKKTKRLILAGCVVHMSAGTHLRVAKVGEMTESGQAQKLIAADSGAVQSKFEEKILNVTMYIIVFTLIDVLVVISVQVELRGYSFWTEIINCLSLIIASVPVALPMVIQITMALGAAKMAEKKAIVTSFPALQDIAGMTVLCSDKTGTLTTANITVSFKDIRTWNGFTKEEVLTYAAVACGESTEDPIDKAVRRSFLESMSEDPSEAHRLMQQWTVTKVVGFTPEVKRFVAYATHTQDGEMKLAKGLLNKVMETGADGGDEWKCEGIDAISEEIRERDTQFAKAGYKTIGVAAGKLVNGQWQMQFAGIIPMIDPPRHDTAEVIRELNDNGIQVRMITGDHKNIAIETAKQIGLAPTILANTEIEYVASTEGDNADIPEEARKCFLCLEQDEPTGDDKAVDAALMVPNERSVELILHAGGFAQVMPTDKLQIVRTFRNSKGGSITGMTGDGVNDAPALKAANVGIAVKGSTAAAQQAADIILTDDGLMPIHTAVVESRMIYARLRSYVLYRIGATIQIVTVLSTLIFAFDMTIEALYVILLALLNDITMLTVSYDNARPNKDPVRPTIFGIMFLALGVGLTMALSSIGFYIVGQDFLTSKFSSNDSYAGSVVYLQISLGIEMMIFNCREPTNWFFIALFDKDPTKYAPCLSLVGSVLFANLLVILLCYEGWIVYQVEPSDIAVVCVYDIIIFFVTDAVKVFIAWIVQTHDLENYFEGKRAVHEAEYGAPDDGTVGGAPVVDMSDNCLDFNLERTNVWCMFAGEVSNWATSRVASGRNCCRRDNGNGDSRGPASIDPERELLL